MAAVTAEAGIAVGTSYPTWTRGPINFCDEKDIKLLGFKNKNDMIEYGRICGVTCLPTESVRAMYLKIAGRPFEDLEDEHHKQIINRTNNKIKVLNNCFYIDFSNGIFNRFAIDKTFYYNEKGICAEGEQKIKKDVIIFNVNVIEYESGELKELKNFSEWLIVTNNYFKIKKISNFGEYYISFQKIKTYLNPVVNTNITTLKDEEVVKRRSLSKKELEKIESDQAIENISNNLREMLINEKALNMLQSYNNTTRVDKESYVLDLVKKVPLSSDVFIKP